MDNMDGGDELPIIVILIFTATHTVKNADLT